MSTSTEAPRVYYDQDHTPLTGNALLGREVSHWDLDAGAIDRTHGIITATNTKDQIDGLHIRWPDGKEEWCDPLTLAIHPERLPPHVQVTTDATDLIHREGKQLLIATDGDRLALHLVDTPKGTHPAPPPPSDTTPPYTP